MTERLPNPSATDHERVGIIGDAHGNAAWIRACLRRLDEHGVKVVHQLGDFGIWPEDPRDHFIRDVDARLTELSMRLYVTPGNHEDWSLIDALPVSDVDDGMGAIKWFTDTIAVLPRGHRWKQAGIDFVSLGGAPSIDFEHRVEGDSWWPAEAITKADVDRVTAAGKARVMLAHDSPHPPYSTGPVAQIIEDNPGGWSEAARTYATTGRDRITEAFLAVQPEVYLHGHYHVSGRGSVALPGGAQSTEIISVSCDDSWKSFGLLDLTSGSAEFEWLYRK